MHHGFLFAGALFLFFLPLPLRQTDTATATGHASSDNRTELMSKPQKVVFSQKIVFSLKQGLLIRFIIPSCCQKKWSIWTLFCLISGESLKPFSQRKYWACSYISPAEFHLFHWPKPNISMLVMSFWAFSAKHLYSLSILWDILFTHFTVFGASCL